MHAVYKSDKRNLIKETIFSCELITVYTMAESKSLADNAFEFIIAIKRVLWFLKKHWHLLCITRNNTRLNQPHNLHPGILIRAFTHYLKSLFYAIFLVLC